MKESYSEMGDESPALAASGAFAGTAAVARKVPTTLLLGRSSRNSISKSQQGDNF